jgi:hypothetical protein
LNQVQQIVSHSLGLGAFPHESGYGFCGCGEYIQNKCIIGIRKCRIPSSQGLHQARADEQGKIEPPLAPVTAITALSFGDRHLSAGNTDPLWGIRANQCF